VSKKSLQNYVKDPTGQAEAIESALCRGNCILSVLTAVAGVQEEKLCSARENSNKQVFGAKKLYSKQLKVYDKDLSGDSEREIVFQTYGCVIRFNVKDPAFCPHSGCMFCLDLSINSDYFPIQH